MAVPKRKTSKSRRDKRRSQHKAKVVAHTSCPQCKSPRLPHRVCPVCGTYAGREVVTQKIKEIATAEPEAESEAGS